ELKEVSEQSGLNFCVKIGGCEAINDLNLVQKLGCSSIVAPMVESPYALKKFILGYSKVYSDNSKTADLYINIESKCGYDNLNEIFNSEEFQKLKGVVMGRHDFVSSFDMDLSQVDSDFTLDCAKKIAQNCKIQNKEFILGGAMTLKSVPFLKKLGSNLADKFETRKIIFDFKLLNEKEIELAIKKAIEFEIFYLKKTNKQNSNRLKYLSDLLMGVL
ncbi:hypothetical protein IJ670_07315, partial [bacterium]|nr:hypothetical protein [bacterium]